MRSHPGCVSAPAGTFVHDDEMVCHVAEDVEERLEGLDADAVDAFCGMVNELAKIRVD